MAEEAGMRAMPPPSTAEGAIESLERPSDYEARDDVTAVDLKDLVGDAGVPDPATFDTHQTVGVVIRTKDRPYFLFRSIGSLVEQTYPSWRAVIVNDGGNAGPIAEVLAQPFCRDAVAAGQIKVIHHKESVGRGSAFNVGMHSLDTRFCCCLDDDDAWAPDFLSRMVAGYERFTRIFDSMGATCSEMVDIDEVLLPRDPDAPFSVAGKDHFSREVRKRKEWAYNNADVFVSPLHYAMQRHNCLPVQLLFDRKKLAEFGGFNELHSVLEDRAMLSHFLCKYRIGIVKGAVAYHYTRQSLAAGHNYKNSMGDNESYDWQFSFRAIETSLFYDRPGGNLLSQMVFLLHEFYNHLTWSDGIAKHFASANRREFRKYMFKNRYRVAAAVAGAAVLQFGISFVAAIAALRLFGPDQ